ncbi:hypothetical protein TrVE_jg10468 [Triparma verrucosa]|uniref:EGF-like domain-containing protein n=1 Tax=Triparma verrucosa TaxID=1606542 RepID=A0A9W7CNY5_9STRA|nr:hypothetical protein TrVE_jg10468 [Triparma verrucosa]
MWHGVELQQSDVTDLYTPHNTAHHFWDFRGCTTGGTVTDSIAGDLVATPMNGPVCGADGLRLDGNNEYADIDDWEWGGTTSIEVYVKYDSFNEYSRVFDFGNGENNDNVVLCNTETTSTIRWAVFQESTNKAIETSNFDSASWTHVVATVSGTTMKVYKNGVLAGTKTDAYEPNVLTRTQHWLGRGAWSNDGYTDGTIAYVKMWHGVELQQSDVTTLYVAREKCVASTSPSDDGSDGNFYCINGGTVDGVSGSCTCTSCNTGFGGSSCQDPLSCVASTSPSDTGSDGNFYCINGGTVSGVSESCTCTSCNTGFGGSSCQDPLSCVASTSASDNGSDGNFYCINGGTVSGVSGSCTCTSCNMGFGGSSCELPACVASTSASDNGSDGNFYCINGGTVGGVSGSCTCTSCNTGFGGSSCQNPLSCVASTSASDTGSDGNLYCINGGTVSGVSGSCTCTCADGYGGSGCEAPEPDMIDGEGDASTLALSFTSVIVVLAAVIGNLW